MLKTKINLGLTLSRSQSVIKINNNPIQINRSRSDQPYKNLQNNSNNFLFKPLRKGIADLEEALRSDQNFKRREPLITSAICFDLQEYTDCSSNDLQKIAMLLDDLGKKQDNIDYFGISINNPDSPLTTLRDTLLNHVKSSSAYLPKFSVQLPKEQSFLKQNFVSVRKSFKKALQSSGFTDITIIQKTKADTSISLLAKFKIDQGNYTIEISELDAKNKEEFELSASKTIAFSNLIHYMNMSDNEIKSSVEKIGFNASISRMSFNNKGQTPVEKSNCEINIHNKESKENHSIKIPLGSSWNGDELKPGPGIDVVINKKILTDNIIVETLKFKTIIKEKDGQMAGEHRSNLSNLPSRLPSIESDIDSDSLPFSRTGLLRRSGEIDYRSMNLLESPEGCLDYGEVSPLGFWASEESDELDAPIGLGMHDELRNSLDLQDSKAPQSNLNRFVTTTGIIKKNKTESKDNAFPSLPAGLGSTMLLRTASVSFSDTNDPAQVHLVQRAVSETKNDVAQSIIRDIFKYLAKNFRLLAEDKLNLEKLKDSLTFGLR